MERRDFIEENLARKYCTKPAHRADSQDGDESEREKKETITHAKQLNKHSSLTYEVTFCVCSVKQRNFLKCFNLMLFYTPPKFIHKYCTFQAFKDINFQVKFHMKNIWSHFLDIIFFQIEPMRPISQSQIYPKLILWPIYYAYHFLQSRYFYFCYCKFSLMVIRLYLHCTNTGF